MSQDSSIDQAADASVEPAVASARPSLVVVYDSPQECPYLDGQVARMPLEYPRRALTPVDLDQLLERGYRRTGGMLYRTRCPKCSECIPARVDVNAFVITKSMRRVLKRCDRDLQVAWGKPVSDAERVTLFNEHRAARELSRNGPVSESEYHEFLVASCVETAEISFRYKGQLIGAAIADVGENSINAVYTHFDPSFGRYSIGTAAVLMQVQYARQTGRQHVYLGLYVAENSHLNYKDRFRPQQRLLNGVWEGIE